MVFMSTFGGKSGLRLELYDIDGAENRGYNSKVTDGGSATSYKALLNNSPSFGLPNNGSTTVSEGVAPVASAGTDLNAADLGLPFRSYDSESDAQVMNHTWTYSDTVRESFDIPIATGNLNTVELNRDDGNLLKDIGWTTTHTPTSTYNYATNTGDQNVTGYTINGNTQKWDMEENTTGTAGTQQTGSKIRRSGRLLCSNISPCFAREKHCRNSSTFQLLFAKK